ncbi:MAG: DNA polymerase III subunit epsilon [Pseudomonadota bacterium]
MREIVLDTETTGFDPSAGDRIVEIGAVELNNHMPTGRVYHQYINPERDMPEEAFQVHGLSNKFLSDKPVFASIADAFMNFIGDAKLVIHNAAFDVKFLNAELSWLERPNIPWAQAIDTLEMARKKFPGAQNSLDALCRRFGVDNSGREKHGALLDSELLAEVYLELVGGRQPDFALSTVGVRGAVGSNEDNQIDETLPTRGKSLASLLTEKEKADHAAFVDTLGETPLWRTLD